MPADCPPNVLVTAGPTWEPLDEVRHLANRSSGRLGVELALASSAAGCATTLLLGPGVTAPPSERFSGRVERFTSAASLGEALERRCPGCDVLLMAAAVADYRPAALEMEDGSRRPLPLPAGEKLPRLAQPLQLVLAPTPDLLAKEAARKRADQLFVGFALAPVEQLEAIAQAKLRRKGVECVVANPLETMDSPRISATLYATGPAASLDGLAVSDMPKEAFAAWLIGRLLPLLCR